MSAVEADVAEEIVAAEPQAVPREKPGLRPKRPSGIQQDDASEEVAKTLKRIQEQNAAQKKTGAANEETYSVDPKLNEECLKAIAKLFEIKQIQLPEELADLSLV